MKTTGRPQEIIDLQKQNAEMRDALEKAMLLLEHGDFTNGVTDGTGTIDEGRTKAGWMIDEIRQVLRSITR